MNILSRRSLRQLRKSAENIMRLPPWEREPAFQQLEQQQQKSTLSSMFGNAPGLGAVVETFEQAWSWGPFGSLIWTPGYIYSGAVDSGNSPTTNLRPGLVLGLISATNQWTNYSPTATDGSQIAQGVLPIGLTMIDFLTSVGQNKAFGIVVGGRVQASKLLGLDLAARATLSPRFVFDDNFVGNYKSRWNNYATKTAAYQVLASDNFTLFDNLGATGSVTFTLPAIANGYVFGFRARAAQNLIVASTEGANMEALNNLVANSVAFQSGGAIVGGEFYIYSNQAGTKWLVGTNSAGAATVTVA